MRNLISNKNDINTNTSRNSMIDVLKGICALFVVICHLDWTERETKILLFPFAVSMAVPVFLFISGYLISVSLHAKNEKFSIGKSLLYFLKKFMNYTIPFACMYIVEMFFYFRWGWINFGLKSDRVFMIKTFISGGVGKGSYYYPLLIQSIIFIPLCHWIVKRLGVKGLWLSGIINGLYELFVSVIQMDEAVYRVIIIRYMLIITAGCYLALKKNIDRKMSLISLGVGILYIICVRYFDINILIVSQWLSTTYLACLYTIPILFWMFDKCKGWHFKPLEAVGKASYHIFLAQMVWLSFGQHYISERVGNRYVYYLINLIICVAAGLIFYYLINPVTSFINKRINKITR